jgi:hypothetical protein
MGASIVVRQRPDALAKRKRGSTGLPHGPKLIAPVIGAGHCYVIQSKQKLVQH